LLKERPRPVDDAIGATQQAYDGSTLTFRLLRACGWGAFLNLGFFHAADWLLRPFRLDVAQGRLARRSIDLLELDGADSCIDVGCGRGRSSFQIAMENPDVTVEAIDFLPENVSAADYLYGNTRNLNYRQGRAEALPFEAESCDRIHCLEAAFHFDRAEFLRSAYRILRPGGRMVIVDFMFKSSTSREILPTPAGRIVRDIWKFKDFWTCDQYRVEATSLGFEAVEEHDWSAHVTTALQYRFSLICWAGTKAPLRRLLCKLNPLLSGFSADDWQILSTQALALAKMRRQLRYVGLVLQKKG
jgi:ubiquinone/menaquinone biosynthesis C-methylase UbiE